MNQSGAASSEFDSRWPAVVAILIVLVLMAMLPGRIRAFPPWFPYVVGAAVLVPMVAVGLSRGAVRWRRIERAIIFLFVAVATCANLGCLGYLVNEMLRRSAAVRGVQLLASSIVVWITNIVLFSLLYWVLDRGGPEARANNADTKPEWLFPQDGAPEAAPHDWRPTFVDYLYLGFSTATAFSATDALPLTSRAKLFMMLESFISLGTMVVVVSRAIGIIGS
jgi:hypothetical protein